MRLAQAVTAAGLLLYKHMHVPQQIVTPRRQVETLRATYLSSRCTGWCILGVPSAAGASIRQVIKRSPTAPSWCKVNQPVLFCKA